MQVQYNFKGQTVFISGASNGIGAATALSFAQAGANLILCDLDEESGNNLARRISEITRVQFYPCNVAKHEEVKAAMASGIQHFGGLDYAFNNAGIEGQQFMTADCTEDNWDKVLDINLKGIWLCMKYQIQQMLYQKSGCIVNCSSVAGLVGFTGIPAYVASKHGVLGLTKAASLEYAEKNIRINSVCPGVIDTPMIDRFTKDHPQAREQLIHDEPMKRMGKPSEIAQAVMWLCSDQSSFITGEYLVVDGGWIAR